MKDWKACERREAQLLGDWRVPVTGRQRGATPDVEHNLLSIEVKSRRRLPSWLEESVKQAETAATTDNRLTHCRAPPRADVTRIA